LPLFKSAATALASLVNEPATDQILEEPLLTEIVVPALIFAAERLVCDTAAIVYAPVRYVPAAIVYAEVLARYVAAALVVTEAVNETEALPAVPALI